MIMTVRLLLKTRDQSAPHEEGNVDEEPLKPGTDPHGKIKLLNKMNSKQFGRN